MPTENQERAFTEPFDPITVGRLLFWRIPNVQVCIRVLRWKCEGTSPIKRSLNTQNASFHFLERCQCFALVFTLSDRASILEKLASSLPSSLPSFLARDRQNPPRPHSKFVRIKTPSSNISSDIQNGKSTRKLSNSINSLKPRKQQQISLERILRLTGWTNWALPRKLKYYVCC